MKVIVLGGAGFVGRKIVERLKAVGGHTVTVASRHPDLLSESIRCVKVDAADRDALTRAIDGQDAVINCITGRSNVIVETSEALFYAMPRSSCRHLVHMSSMAAFGDITGIIDDATPLGSGGGWYAEAKRKAEQILGHLPEEGISVVMLRPGCVYGPGSDLWVTRFGHWIRQGRLGDLGFAGDGWSNLVLVDDVAKACVSALAIRNVTHEAMLVNLVADDSPRWNGYITRFACAINATPVRRIPSWQLKADAIFTAVPLRIWERVAPRFSVPNRYIPPALPPSLLDLFSQERKLISSNARNVLKIEWSPFEKCVAASASWYLNCFSNGRG